MRRNILVTAILMFAFFGFSLGNNESPSEEDPYFPEDSLWVANGLDNTLNIIDTETLSNFFYIVDSGTNPYILSASPDGRYIYVINAGEHDRDPNAHGEEEPTVNSIEQKKHDESRKPYDPFSSNSLWVYSSGTGIIITKIQVGTGPTHAIPSPDGKFIYVTKVSLIVMHCKHLPGPLFR